MSLPAAYQWLGAEQLPPLMLIEALKLYGVTERAGDENNPVILDWAKELGPQVAARYTADSIPWCGLFMGVVAKRAGFTPPMLPERARQWSNFGVHQDDPSLGDLLVFERGGGGHVGLYIGEDPKAYHVLGGNQGDAVSIVRIGKVRLLAVRAPAPRGVEPARILLSMAGAPSTNEA